jgi:diamine N-acetyltransferase
MISFMNADMEDLYKVREIAYITWPDTFGTMLPTAQIDYMLNLIYNDESLSQQVKQGHQFILAEQNDNFVGFCSYEINYESSTQFMIHKLYLLPSVQGWGIGTQFLNHLTEIAILNKNTMLRLKVFYLNLKALRFYVKHGFRKAGTEVTQFKNNYAILDFVLIK